MKKHDLDTLAFPILQICPGMALIDYMATHIPLPLDVIEDIQKCDDTDLLDRFGTEEEKEHGFSPCNPSARNLAHWVCGREELGGRMPFSNIELRLKLESRARAAIRYAEATAMMEERMK